MDGSDQSFSLSNLNGTAGWVLAIVVLAALGIVGFGIVFKGHVQF